MNVLEGLFVILIALLAIFGPLFMIEKIAKARIWKRRNQRQVYEQYPARWKGADHASR